ncbi:MAG: DUF3566 domain-containing protein [Actinomycetota bacterium]
MSSRRDDPEIWRTEAETSSASGGHVTPDPLFDTLGTPSAVPEAAYERREKPERTDVIPRGAPVSPEHYPTPRRRPRPALRRVRRTLKHVDPLSVLKISLIFYACFLVLWLLFVAFVYWILSGAGLFDAIENFRRGFAFEGRFDVSLWTVERWAFVIGLSFSVLASLVNVFIAFLYNVGADAIGGVEMTFVERDL